MSASRGTAMVLLEAPYARDKLVCEAHLPKHLYHILREMGTTYDFTSNE